MVHRCALKTLRFRSFLQRYFSQTLSPPDPQTFITQAESKATRVYLKAHEKEAATLALQYYLANHKGISLHDATHISKGAPAFIRKLLLSFVGENATSRLSSTYIDMKLQVETFLEKGGVNEAEPFLESIGLSPLRMYEILPKVCRSSSGFDGLIGGTKVLTNAGVPWKKVWKVLANDTQLLDLTPEELRARIQGLRGLGFDEKDVADLIQIHPLVLKADFQNLMKPVMQQLEKLNVKQQVIEYLCSSHRAKNMEFGEPNMQKIIKILEQCKLKNVQISEIISTWPQIIFGMSADEMASKIEFLKGLMLTDIQIGKIIFRYPEILIAGSKNDPKLRIQFLENIGFQRAEIGRLILRDPHIFHNCTKSSIHPKMDYFETLGIDKEGFKKVVMSFPSITGCSLELNLKQKVQFYESIGLKKEIIASMIRKAPTMLALSVEQNIKPKMEFLEGIGVTKEDIAKIVMKYPAIMYLSVEQNLKPKVEFLKRVGFDDKSIVKLFVVRPSIWGRSLDGNLSEKVKFLTQFGYVMGSASLARALSYLYTMRVEAMELRLHELEKIGLTKEEIRKIVRRLPGVLYVSKQQMDAKIQYLIMTMNLSVKELVKYPVYFNYSLEKRIKPRHRFFVWLNERGLLNRRYTLSFNSLSESAFFSKYVRKFPGGEEVYNAL